MNTQTLTGAQRQRPMWPFTLARTNAASTNECAISPAELRRLVAAMID
ncbi:MAG: hypothetical protein V4647_07655 [Pseudomonadota bacterium]